MKLVLGTLVLAALAITPVRAAESLRGDFVEVRSNQVYT